MIERDKNTSCLKEIPALPRVTPVDSAGNYFFEIATFVNNILAVLEENADKIPVEDLKVVERNADDLPPRAVKLRPSGRRYKAQMAYPFQN